MKPTAETYAELQLGYDTFNKRLFDNKLPECLITLQREKRAYGYFSAERFANRNGDKVDEIAMNPTYFAVVPLIEIMQTLAHEMAHLWQHHHGNPGRGRYHNNEWADKMEAIGLMPSNTGRPGGKRTGDQMADYPIEGGLFLEVCGDLLTRDFKISWYDRFASASHVQVGQNSFGLTLDLPEGAASVAALEGVEMAAVISPSASGASNKSNRSKYTCACDINVWGKPGLNLVCGDCAEQFSEQV
ncbi:SprT-like domain-containing protein [Burkholderia sp. Tr-20390]|uniref:SprT-like domain-containing protein n=1 Tax=Burkholderia sp. Tr-20390 TaxID=2703904 RepID=UPI00197FA7B6|nr:SprT-like domain-containing protein [Burkholderia sp. Tr-20390]MBN3733192.1 SprT family zinc-dependent metalloprotease [Burkholderia sp. Tr-20390]